MEAKEAFERYCHSHGVTVSHYHADNGRFADNLFRQAVASKNQSLTFCGVNAHHQNGVAERCIQELQDHALTMLIHAHHRWPDAIDAHLWPYALRTANDIMNVTPRLKSQDIPLQKFSSSNVNTDLKNWYHFGCPVYVLQGEIQQGKAWNKWLSRSRVAIYLGRSPNHARSVALCLSLETGCVSPQFHFKVDPTFQTMWKASKSVMPKSKWQEKCHFRKPTPDQVNRVRQRNSSSQPRWQIPAEPSEGAQIPQQLGHPVPVHPSEGDEGDVPETSPTEPIYTRSGRESRPPQRLIEAFAAEIAQANNDHEPYEVLRDIHDDDANEQEHPMMAYAASSDPDVMYLHEAMQQPDREEFKKAMTKEVKDQEARNNWEVVRREHVPTTATILPAVWAMRRKRRINTQEVYKWKARLNIDGSKQTKGVNFWETYAPVASWLVIRLVLTIAILNGWETRQIDYVLAYPQATVETSDMYMKIPKGMEIPGAKKDEYVLHLLRNIYGQKQAGRVWNKHLVAALTHPDVGFKQSEHDECVFYNGKAMYVLYTDDSILTGPDPKELDDIIAKMKTKLDITVEGNVSDFLGVNIDQKSDGSIHMTQPHLIDRILKDLRLDHPDCSSKETPAKIGQLLKRGTNSEDFDGHFHYSSVIGKLNYLAQSTRPDIAYAVHQCARFSANPKKEHGMAVTWLGRYLKGTRDKGLIMKPEGGQDLICNVDADFAGNWDKDEALNDPDTARSRSGYVIKYANCPVIWASKLQTTIALSTTEAEYCAISKATRDVIPMMGLLKEMKEHSIVDNYAPPQIHCKIFEDNSGAIELATNDKWRPCTKHINVQYHHFRSYVNSGQLSVKAIESDEQEADILTKPVPVSPLKKHRFTMMGW